MAKRAPNEIADDLKKLARNSRGNEDRVSLLQDVQTYQEELKAQNEALVQAQQQLEQTRDLFVSLFDFAPNGYVIMNDHGLIQRVNLTAATLLGKPRHSIEGLPLFGFVAAADRQKTLDFLRRCRSGDQDSQTLSTEISVRSSDATVPVQIICRPSFGGKASQPELFVTIIDISERRQLEIERDRAASEHAALARRLLSIQDEERRRIARDLHDNVGQQITSLRLMLDIIAMKSLDEEAHARVRQSLSIVEQLDKNLDFIAAGLRPTALDVGLVAAIEQFVREWAKTFGIDCSFHSDDLDDLPIMTDVATHLYRVVQEALNNILKHAGATTVTVAIERREPDLVLTIADDGCGFDARAADIKAGLGLLGMRERAQIVGALIDIRSSPRHGTTITLQLPLQTSPPPALISARYRTRARAPDAAAPRTTAAARRIKPPRRLR
jgi:PAS domain S-box-containing protein